MSALADDVRALARQAALPEGGNGPVLSLDDVRKLSERHNVPGRMVEIEALRHGVRPLRYLRNQQTVAANVQLRLLESSMAQVGLGGLGGTLLELCLRAGVGTIRCADGDTFEESNLNRQALSAVNTLGQSKARAARDKAAAINPSVELEATNAYLTPETLPAFLERADVAVDALGGLDTRLHLQHAAAEAGIPLVTGALAGWTGYVGVSASGNSDYDPINENTGVGGVTQGEYKLRLTFTPGGVDPDDSATYIGDGDSHLVDADGQATKFDGDADGVPGGVYNYWFNVQDENVFVDKASTSTVEDGTLANPYKTIDKALAEAGEAGVIIRVLGNNYYDDDPNDLSTYENNVPYEIGTNPDTYRELADGDTLEVPPGRDPDLRRRGRRQTVGRQHRCGLLGGRHRPLEWRPAGSGHPRILRDLHLVPRRRNRRRRRPVQ